MHWQNVIKNLDIDGNELVFVSQFDLKKVNLDIKSKHKYINIKIKRSSLNLLSILREIISFIKILYKEKPDIVHSFYLKSSFIASIGSLLIKSKYLFFITGLGFLFNTKSIFSFIYTKLVGLFFFLSIKYNNKNCIIVETDDLKSKILKEFNLKNNKIKILPGVGIDTNKYTANDHINLNKDIQFVMISRLVLDKGVIEYIEAAEKISKEFKNIRFILIGERDKDAPLRISDSQYKKLLNSSVEYKGYKNSINSELKKHNVFVLPSYHEGLSVSSMEAASSGLSLLLSDITGCKEIVIEGHNGFTFKPKSTESLYLGMKKIIGNKNKLDLFGRNSRKLIIEKFSKEIIIKKMNFIYEELK